MPSIPRHGSAHPARGKRWLHTGLVLLTGAVIAGGVALRTSAMAPAQPGQAGLTAASGRRELPSYVPMWALTVATGGSAMADLGPAPANALVSARVYLAGRDARGLAAYAAAVADPGSGLFHRYLTPGQVQARFGPASEQVVAVRSWLVGAGLEVTGVTAHYVSVSGTAAQAAAAFGSAWHSYQVNGTTQQAPPPGAAPTAPGTVAAAVLTVAPTETGLPAPPQAPSAQVTAPRAGQVTAAGSTRPPCSRYFGQALATSLPPTYGHPAPYGVCGYTPQQLRLAYGVPTGLTGAGVTVAVVHPWQQPTAAHDLATFGARHAEPLRPGQFAQILPPGLNASCPDGIHAGNDQITNEETDDVEAVHAMAPAARIVYLGTECDDDLGTLSDLDALTSITDHHLASIVSCSWGTPHPSPGLIAAFEQIFQQGAAEGIGFYFSSGDHGDNSQHSAGHQPTVAYPASDPWATAVGGTSLAIGADGRYEWETGWGDDDAMPAADGGSWADLPGTFDGGSGGGTSTMFTQPPYQRHVVPDSLSRIAGSTTPMRVIPDIATDADGATGMLTGQTRGTGPGQPAQYEEGVFGGTSASAPLIAGMQADAQQAAGTPIGFANPAIYARYGSPAYHDVTDRPLGPGTWLGAALPAGVTGNTQPELETFGMDLGLTATAGYDDVTGVGTPTPGYFATYRSGNRVSVASSGAPSKYLASTRANAFSSGAAAMNSVMDERSFIASTAPKMSAALFPSVSATIVAHSMSRGPRTWWWR
jgi:subtilase family serine protease